MAAVPRRAWQSLTLFLAIFGPCLWEYLQTRNILFLMLTLLTAFGGVWSFARDIAHARAGKADPQGFTSLFVDDWAKLFFAAAAVLSFVFDLYRMLRDRSFFPAEAYKIEPAPFSWFMFAGLAVVTAVWVVRWSERLFFVIVGLYFLSDATRPLLLSHFYRSEYFGEIAKVAWLITSLLALALLGGGLWLFRKFQESRRHREA